MICAVGVREIVAQFGADRLRQRLAALSSFDSDGILDASSIKMIGLLRPNGFILSFQYAFVKITTKAIEE